MSNASVLARLDRALQDLEERRMTAEGFLSVFIGSIQALDAVPYAVITRMRELQYRLEVSRYAEEEECLSNLPDVIQEVRRFIEELRDRLPS